MENIFWNCRKVRIFCTLKYACYLCTTVVCWIVWVCSNALSLYAHNLWLCFFPKGCVRTLLAPMQALSIVSMPPKPFRCIPRFPLITRVSYATTVCVLQPPDNNKVRAVQPHCGSRSLISVVLYIAGWSYHTRPCLRIRNQHQKHLFVKFFEISLR